MQDNIPGGFIVLHRKMLNWEWYDDANTKIIFLHLLLTANYEQKKWHGITIERGQVVTSLRKLSDTLGLSKDTIMRSLKKLESTGELRREPTAGYTIITLKNYCLYQDVETRVRHERDTSATQARPDPTQHNKYNNDNNDNKENKEDGTRTRGTDARSLPASVETTEQKLIETYGIEATERYKKRFRRWCEKKNITDRDCISTIAEWMRQDGVKPMPPKDSSLDFEEIDRRMLDAYLKQN